MTETKLLIMYYILQKDEKEIFVEFQFMPHIPLILLNKHYYQKCKKHIIFSQKNYGKVILNHIIGLEYYDENKIYTIME